MPILTVAEPTQSTLKTVAAMRAGHDLRCFHHQKTAPKAISVSGQNAIASVHSATCHQVMLMEISLIRCLLRQRRRKRLGGLAGRVNTNSLPSPGLLLTVISPA